MADQSAFDKLHVDERDKADLGGVLEQLNLPPKFVEFVRNYQKAIYIILGIVAFAVVSWSLYGSYVDNRLTKSSTALALAEKKTGEEKTTALQNVMDEFGGTDSARWAKIEVARNSLENKEFDKALNYYTEIRNDIKPANPLHELLTFGIAQTLESLEKYDQALEEYNSLKNIEGYESIGYGGVARIYEMQGKTEQAVYEYEQYLGTLSDPSGSAERAYISEKLSRLKATL